MYALIKENKVVEYPTSINAWRIANPTTSLPEFPTEQQLNEIGIFNVALSPEPILNFDQIAEKTIELVNESWSEVWKIRQCTDAELDAKKSESAARIREKRNQELQKTDWTQVADAPVDREAWAVYRQSLRDITSQESFPISVEWPSTPN